MPAVTLTAEEKDVILDSLPITGEFRAGYAFGKDPSFLNAAILVASVADLGAVAKALGREVHGLEKGARSLDRRAADHEEKAAAFRKDPSVKPGMEGQNAEKIAAQQKARASKLERDAEKFREKAEEKRRQIQQIQDAQQIERMKE